MYVSYLFEKNIQNFVILRKHYLTEPSLVISNKNSSFNISLNSNNKIILESVRSHKGLIFLIMAEYPYQST